MRYIRFIFFFATFGLFAQNNTMLDSMYHVVKHSKNDTIIANTHYELAWTLKLKDLPAAKLHMDSAMIAYQNLKLPRKIALSNFQYSVLHRLGGDYDEAIQSLTAYQNYVEKVKDTANWIYAYYEKGVIYAQKSDLEISLKEFYKAIELSEATGNTGMANTSLNSVGLVYIDLEKYDEAILAFKKVLKGYDALDIKSEFLGDVYNGLASAYKHQKKYDDAIENFDKAKSVYEKNNSEFGIAIASFNKARIYIEQKRFKEALPLLKLAYEKQKANGYVTELTLTISSFAETHFELGNYEKSESLLNEGLQLDMESKLAAKDLYFELYRINSIKKQYKKALEFHEDYVKYKDSVYNEENIKSINLLQKQFETEKKNKELAEQQLALQQQENKIQKQENQMTLLYSLALLLVLTTISIWLIFKQKQKRKHQELLAIKKEAQINSLESLIEGEEKERFRIAKELHDGVNGDLSAIKHKLNSLLKLNNETIQETVKMIDKSCEQVRAISHNLVPPALKDFDLQAATSDYCANMNATYVPEISFTYLGEPLNLDKIVEINIFRIVQELVTNSLKHAEASEINVQLSQQNNVIQLVVEDDGKGFDVTEASASGIGISNIKNRVAFLNGSIDFESNTSGTAVNVIIEKANINVH